MTTIISDVLALLPTLSIFFDTVDKATNHNDQPANNQEGYECPVRAAANKMIVISIDADLAGHIVA